MIPLRTRLSSIYISFIRPLLDYANVSFAQLSNALSSKKMNQFNIMRHFEDGGAGGGVLGIERSVSV